MEPSSQPNRLRSLIQKATRAAQLPIVYANWTTAFRNRLLGRDLSGRSVAYTIRGGPTLRVATGSEDLAIINDVWIDRCYERDPDFVPRPGWTVVDLGSNKGSFAARVIHQTGNQVAQMICVEPDPENFSYLTQNVAQNVHVELVNAAVGSTPGEATLHRVRGSSGQHSISGSRASAQGPLQEPLVVRQVTLGEVVSMCRNDVDLMKIDIEGQEYEVLVRGDVEPLRKVRRLVLEYDAFDPSEPTIGPEAIIDRLASLGFAAAYSKASRGSGRLIYATRQ